MPEFPGVLAAALPARGGRRGRRRPHVGWRVVLVTAAFLLACGGTDPSPPRQKLEEAYWGLALNHHAVLLSTTAPWDTLPLVATPLNYLGDTLPGLGTPEFSSSDIQHVTVTPDGVLHAIDVMAPGAEVKVTARLTVNNVTHTDTVYVRVSATGDPPPVLESLSIHPLPGDSAKLPVGGYYFYKVTPLAARSADPHGDSIPNLPVAIRSSDQGIAFFDRGLGVVSSLQPGVVTFYASTTAFGVTKADTLPYRIGWPVLYTISVRRVVAPLGSGADSLPVFLPSEVTVGTGAIVQWDAQSSPDVKSDNIDITFAEAQLPQVVDPPTIPSVIGEPGEFLQFCDLFNWDCSAGHIAFGPEHRPIALRGFTAPGTYEYHSAALGISGRVIVVDER